MSTIAGLLVAILIGGVAAWRINLRSKADGLVKRLLDAEVSGLEDAIEELKPYQDLVRDDLTARFQASDEDPTAKLHAGLALVGEDPAVLPYLKEQLLEVTAAQFAPVRDLLKNRKHELTDELWKITLNGELADQRRFQAACALASYDPDNAQWQDAEVTEFIAGHLVTENPLRLSVWIDALRPVRQFIVPPLGEIFRDKRNGSTFVDPERGRPFRSATTLGC